MQAGGYYGDLTALIRDAFHKPYTRIKIKPRITIDRSVILTDVSFYQGETDFSLMKQAGAEGTIIRAGQNLWKDTKFDEYYAKAKTAGLPRGSYFFYDSRVDPISQARLWASILNNDHGELDHAADYEERYDGDYGGWVNLYKFMSEFQMKTGLPDERVPLYTGYYYWLSAGKAPLNVPGSMEWFKRHRLWLAWYSANPDAVKIPQPWDEASLLRWQYTSGGMGALYGVSSATIDLNNHNGNEQSFRSFYGLGVPPAPVLEPFDVTVTIRRDGYADGSGVVHMEPN
jgi:GH25 family lysozyme M1 (1,4-beta-N-acetylmuramidase)